MPSASNGKPYRSASALGYSTPSGVSRAGNAHRFPEFPNVSSYGAQAISRQPWSTRYASARGRAGRCARFLLYEFPAWPVCPFSPEPRESALARLPSRGTQPSRHSRPRHRYHYALNSALACWSRRLLDIPMTIRTERGARLRVRLRIRARSRSVFPPFPFPLTPTVHIPSCSYARTMASDRTAPSTSHPIPHRIYRFLMHFSHALSASCTLLSTRYIFLRIA